MASGNLCEWKVGKSKSFHRAIDKNIFLSTFLLSVVFFFNACTVTPVARDDIEPESSSAGVFSGHSPVEGAGSYDPGIVEGSDGRRYINNRADALSELQIRLLEASRTLLGKAPGITVSLDGKSFLLDCIGTVSSIYYQAGIDLFQDLGPSRGGASGVEVLYNILEAEEALYSSKLPAVGDIIFWDNTYDKNDDGIIGNDPKTHVGLVVKIEKDGTIHYLHENYYTGIVIERMNLYRPTTHRDPITGKLLNSPLFDGSYFANPNNPEHWMAGDLWRNFGGVLKLVDH